MAIQYYQKSTTRKKPNFFFLAFIIDVFCTEFQYPHLGWNWTLPAPPVPIYYLKLWDNNYMDLFYDICEHFMGTIYFKIFKVEAPSFSVESTALIATMGDWYVSESFSYIRVCGGNTIHTFPKIVPDRLVLEEVSFQIITNGVYRKILSPKRKGWPKFPLKLRSVVVPISTWATLLGDQIASLNLGFALKRRHDPKGFLDAHYK